jgi:membrane-associated phospholipid phosphatase
VRTLAVRRPGPLVAIALGYLTAASGVMIWRGISVSPDYLLLLMVPIALLSGRFLRFLGDWVPFVAIFLGWEAMRGIAPKTGIAPHIGDLASAETWVFGGHVPSAVLQQAVHATAVRGAFDYLATVLYFSHFVFPLTVGLVLWLVNRRQFLRYTTALLGMALVAFIVFLLVPTAPPWCAAGPASGRSLAICSHAYVSGFHTIIGTTLPSAVSPYYNSLNPNPVAAMPSLHAAFPFLAFLALRPVFPRGAWAALGWSLAVWFSVVYLGEHWAIDVFAGVLMAALAWAVLMRVVVPRVPALQAEPAASEPPRAAEAGAGSIAVA